jgi:DNA-binding NarL/FixJ family response regulator
MKPNGCPTSVLIADPNDVSRLGLRAVLAADPRFRVVGDTGHDVLVLALRLRPDLIVLDPAVDGQIDSGIIRDLRERCSDSRLCIRTSVFEPHSFIEAMEIGVLGYLLKEDHDAALLCDVLAVIGQHGVAVGGPAVVEACHQQLAGHLMLMMPRPAEPPLSERERETLRLVAAGCTNGDVARCLGVAANTVGSYVERLKVKLGAETRAELIVVAMRRGLLGF